MSKLDPMFDHDTVPTPSDTAGATPGFAPERPVRPAMWRGWRRRCPNCGKGPMMKSYLKVRDTCPVCDQELGALHRADDGPAYLTILTVGHLMAPALLWVFVAFQPEPMVLASVFTVGGVALSLFLLPRFKGAIVGLQWAKRLHGFSDG